MAPRISRVSIGKTKREKIARTKTTKSVVAKRTKSSASTMTSTSTATALIHSGHRKLTPFRTKVYLALCQVPEGKVTTYKYLSHAVACGSSQAIGQALKNNPYAPTVPCHRVIQSDLSLGGFGGARSGEKIDKKIHLLKSEGVVVHESGTVDPSCVYKFACDSTPHV